MATYNLAGVLSDIGCLSFNGQNSPDAEIVVEVMQHEVERRLCNSTTPIKLVDAIQWRARIELESVENPYSRDLLRFCQLHRDGEMVKVGRFGRGLIRDCKMELRVITEYDGIRDGHACYRYVEKETVRVEIDGIGELTVTATSN